MRAIAGRQCQDGSMSHLALECAFLLFIGEAHEYKRFQEWEDLIDEETVPRIVAHPAATDAVVARRARDALRVVVVDRSALLVL